MTVSQALPDEDRPVYRLRPDRLVDTPDGRALLMLRDTSPAG
jgi:hypothetical protein